MKDKDIKPVKVVRKLILLFEALANEEEIGITELAKKIGESKSTIYRFLISLKELGYVTQNSKNEKYRLTLRLFEIGSAVLDRLDERKEALPVMENLAEQTLETIHLAILDENKLVYLHKIDSTQTLRVAMSSRIGRNAPLYCTGVGKVLLAWCPPNIVNKIIGQKEMLRYTKNTITDPIQLAAELQKIRNEGYAIDNEEHEEGVRCVAAPIRNRDGEVVAAISISGPKIRMADDRIGAFKELVMNAANEISKRLGYSV